LQSIKVKYCVVHIILLFQSVVVYTDMWGNTSQTRKVRWYCRLFSLPLLNNKKNSKKWGKCFRQII